MHHLTLDTLMQAVIAAAKKAPAGFFIDASLKHEYKHPPVMFTDSPARDVSTNEPGSGIAETAMLGSAPTLTDLIAFRKKRFNIN